MKRNIKFKQGKQDFLGFTNLGDRFFIKEGYHGYRNG